MEVSVTSAVAADPRPAAAPTAADPGLRDGVLHRPVSQPPGVAPVHALPPGLAELRQGGHGGVLALAGLLGSQEAQLVAATRVLVGEHHTWAQSGSEDPGDLPHKSADVLQSLSPHPRAISAVLILNWRLLWRLTVQIQQH